LTRSPGHPERVPVILAVHVSLLVSPMSPLLPLRLSFDRQGAVVSGWSHGTVKDGFLLLSYFFVAFYLPFSRTSALIEDLGGGVSLAPPPWEDRLGAIGVSFSLFSIFTGATLPGPPPNAWATNRWGVGCVVCFWFWGLGLFLFFGGFFFLFFFCVCFWVVGCFFFFFFFGFFGGLGGGVFFFFLVLGFFFFLFGCVFFFFFVFFWLGFFFFLGFVLGGVFFGCFSSESPMLATFLFLECDWQDTLPVFCFEESRFGKPRPFSAASPRKSQGEGEHPRLAPLVPPQLPIAGMSGVLRYFRF